MSIQFVFGASGSGKSTLLYKTIIEESIREPDRQFLVIVPEQFTLQTQRELVMLHPDKGILNIDVLSFQRLAYRVMEQTGCRQKDILTESGKNLVLRKVSHQVQDQLTVLGNRLDRQGTITLIKSALSEFSQYGIEEEQLRDMIGLCKSRSTLKKKLEDMLVLMRAFDACRRDRFRTAEEILGILAHELPHAGTCRGASIVLDGFTGFTPLQIRVLEQMMKTAGTVRIALTLDPGEEFLAEPDEQDLFYLTKKTVHTLTKLAMKTGTQILEPEWVSPGAGRFAAGSGLKYLQERLLHTGREMEQEGNSFRDTVPGDIHLYECAGPSAEADFAAETIRRLVHEQRLRFGEIAVITGSMSSYEHHLVRALEEYDIPYFVDHKVNASLNPMLEFIRSVLDAAAANLSYESVMRLLRTGLTGFGTDQIDQFDNYLLAKGIRGINSWKKEWIRPSGTIPEESLEEINRMRDALIRKLEEPLRILQHGSEKIDTYVGAVRELLNVFEIGERMKEKAAWFRDAGDETSALRAMEYEQIAEVVEQVLTQAENLIGDETVPAREFARILEAGFEEAKVGLVPPGLDQVYVGDLQRTRLSHIRTLIFTGMNDGFVPSVQGTESILSQADRTFLLREGCLLAPDERTDGYIQRFYQYLCLTKPSDSLIISWSVCDAGGSPMRPSYLVGTLRRLFPQLRIHRPFEEGSRILSDRKGLQLLAQECRRQQETGEETDPVLMEHLGSRTETAGIAAYLPGAAAYELKHAPLAEETARNLYGEQMTMSISRMETFAGCPYQFFVRYGLKLKEREEYRIQAADIGSLMHDAMAIFSRELSTHPLFDWYTVPESVWREMVDRAIHKADENTGSTLFTDTGRGAGTFARMQRILSRSVWAMLEQIRAGSFVPVLFEQGFRRTLPDENLIVTGQIDRIDLASDDTGLYVKVVDYKTGEKKFQYKELFDGRDIQLAVYLQEAMEMAAMRHPGVKPEPAGMFYYCVKDPVADAGASDLPAAGDQAAYLPEKIREKQLSQMKTDGLINQDDGVLSLYCTDLSRLGLYTPAAVTAGGKLRSSKALVTGEDLRRISGYALQLLRRQSRRIRCGQIESRPCRSGRVLHCEWCAYSEVCGFDAMLPGARTRMGSILTDEQILEIIRET